MNFFKQSLTWFQEQSIGRRLGLGSGLLLIIVLSIVMFQWVMTPAYGVLFNHLDNDDAGRITRRLDEAQISWRAEHQGQDILIDRRLIDKTRIQLMGTDLALTHSVGFELFDKSDFGMTDFSQKINYQRALQGELERTITSLVEIRQARVHLVIPENRLFHQDSNPPRAAVTLHLNQALSARQIQSIQQLIAAGVAGLPPDQVVIVDQNGNGLTPKKEVAGSNHFAAKKRLEQYLNDKVMQLLRPIFPFENVMVKIDATLNYDEMQRELELPRREGFVTHEKETRHSITAKTEKTPANQDFTREKSYQSGREKEHFIRANGTIERLTISVVLPETTPVEKTAQVERLVKSVVGFDGKRGDTISVEALILPAPSPAETAAPMLSQPKSSSGSFPLPLIGGVIGLMLLFSVGLVFHLRQRARRRQILLNELSQWLLQHE